MDNLTKATANIKQEKEIIMAEADLIKIEITKTIEDLTPAPRNLVRDPEVAAVTTTTTIETGTMVAAVAIVVPRARVTEAAAMRIPNIGIQILIKVHHLDLTILEKETLSKTEVNAVPMSAEKTKVVTEAPLPNVTTRPLTIPITAEVVTTIEDLADINHPLEEVGTQEITTASQTEEATRAVASEEVTVAASEEASEAAIEAALEEAVAASVVAAIITRTTMCLIGTHTMKKQLEKALHYLLLHRVLETQLDMVIITQATSLNINNLSIIHHQTTIKVVLRINNHHPITNKNNESTIRIVYDLLSLCEQ
jgi:hypothetical protein